MRKTILFSMLIGSIFFSMQSSEADLPLVSCTNTSDTWTENDKEVLDDIVRMQKAYEGALIKVKGMDLITVCRIESRVQEHLWIDEDYTDDSYDYWECVLDHYAKLCSPS
ncbi:MAG: hypothetical protein F4044_04630 [Rhodobacteraceae bacterium]|nr:hypothetical protein [Paracoccaceae bacterium]